MGYNFKNPIIIEFNGLPGSGKTTTSKILQNRFECNKQKTFNRYFRKKYHRNVYSVLFTFRYRKILKAIIKYLNAFPTKVKKSIVYSYVSYIRMYNNFFDDNNKGVLLIDQGIVQSLISLAHNKSLPVNDDLRDLLLSSKFNRIPIIFINCLSDEKLSMSRIEAREFRGARVDTMNKTEMYRTLCAQSRNFDKIRTALKELYPDLHVINIDMNESPESNVELISQYLTKVVC